MGQPEPEPAPYDMVSPIEIPDGLEPAPHSQYPEVIPSPVLPPKATYSPSSDEMGYRPPPVAMDSAPGSPYGDGKSSGRYELSADAQPRSRILGLRRTTFFLVLLQILVIIIAAVGGGVGGSMAVRKAYDRGIVEGAGATVTVSSPSATPTSPSPASTASGSRVTQPPRSGFTVLDCPNLNGTTHKLSPGGPEVAFLATCGTNHPAENGSVDITLIPTYSFDDCLIACASWNVHAKKLSASCVGVHYNAGLAAIGIHGGNCWLKSKFGGMVVTAKDDTEANNMIEAELVD